VSATQLAEQMKLAGMDQSARKHKPDLTRAQMVAQMLGMDGTIVTADDVRKGFFEHYDRPLKIGNAIGSLFADGKWELVGYVKSKRPEARHRVIQTWRLKETYKPAHVPSDVAIADGQRICANCSKDTEECVCHSQFPQP
jgi:hypothetical protein